MYLSTGLSTLEAQMRLSAKHAQAELKKGGAYKKKIVYSKFSPEKRLRLTKSF